MKQFWHHAIHLNGRVAGVQTQYGISVEGDEVWLSIQGSVQKEDWFANFDFPAVPYKDMPVRWYAHAGFVKRWKAARDQIVAEVKAAMIPGKVLKITGYSHGGALAVLAHEDFKFLGYEPETVVFGCPRVLWFPPKQVLARFAGVTRVENSGDIVTTVPPTLMGYWHVGEAWRRYAGAGRFPIIKWHMIPEYDGLVNT